METPDFVRKLDWAEKHLEKLEVILTAFVEAHPYEVRHTVEGKRQRHVFTLRMLQSIDPAVPLIVGDFLYNVRAALDYLAAALAPPSERRRTMFPVVTEPVWALPWAEGEQPERTTMRRKWELATRHMAPEAVAILQEAQPLEERAKPPNWHVLALLNQLSNGDRHRQLSALASGIRDVDFKAFRRSGLLLPGGGENLGPLSGLQDGARVRVPPGVVKVEVEGTALIVIRGGQDGRHVLLPDRLRDMLSWARDIVGQLSQHRHESM